MTFLDAFAPKLRRRLHPALLLLSFLLGGCSDAYECTSQSVGGQPVEGCTDLFGCDRLTCEVSFGGCDDDAMPSIECEGTTCTCFDGDQQIGSCDYAPDQCPSDLDLNFSGDDTKAMQFFESCCGVAVERG